MRACRPLRRVAAHLRYDVLRALGQDDRAEWFRRDQAAEDPSAPWLATSRWQTANAAEDPEAAGAALADVRALFAKHPKDEGVLAVLAQEALTAHRYPDAADLLERLIGRLDRPGARRLTVPDAYLVLGTALLAAGRDAAADEAFRLFVKGSSQPADAERRVLASRAGALLASGRLDEAARSYEQLTGGEAAAEAFVGLAMCSVHQGEAERAAGMLDRAQELGYPSATARFLRAQIQVDLGRVAEADRLAHEAAEERPPSDPEALYIHPRPRRSDGPPALWRRDVAPLRRAPDERSRSPRSARTAGPGRRDVARSDQRRVSARRVGAWRVVIEP